MQQHHLHTLQAPSLPMARVSFGSRAGTDIDYGSSGGVFSARSGLTSSGPLPNLSDLNEHLKAEIAGGSESLVPECTTCELSLMSSAIIPLIRPALGNYSEGGDHDLPQDFKTNWQDVEHANGHGTMEMKSTPHTSIGNILAIQDTEARQIVQRAASRGIVQTLESTDGFKYSFNNAWAAKDDGGLRFSYICQDSMQNKDRHANGYQRTQKHLKTVAPSPVYGPDGTILQSSNSPDVRGPRKPTYDCKGSVSVKFSAQRGCVDVYYRHYAIHPTVAARKNEPRPPPKPRTIREARPANTARPLKRKRDEMHLNGQPVQSAVPGASSAAAVPSYMQPPPVYRPEPRSLSLAEILRQEPSAYGT